VENYVRCFIYCIASGPSGPADPASVRSPFKEFLHFGFPPTGEKSFFVGPTGRPVDMKTHRKKPALGSRENPKAKGLSHVNEMKKSLCCCAVRCVCRQLRQKSFFVFFNLTIDCPSMT
jgi:hypothetical protein